MLVACRTIVVHLDFVQVDEVQDTHFSEYDIVKP